jgi:hypothetical protein
MKITRTDMITGKLNTLDLDINIEQYNAWKFGRLIQDVMPHLSADEREFLITGIMPGTFEEHLGEPEDEDEKGLEIDLGLIKTEKPISAF